MSMAEVESPPALPDYLTDPSAVLKDSAQWRYGKAPDYSNTRAVWEQTRTTTHRTPDLPSLVENLVKNWEIEASFKSDLADWRTVDHPNYTFAINGGPPQTAEYMLKVGTYNAIIAEPNEFYSPRTSDFASSHKTFKHMMPTFAWEVLEVYSGPPQVAFRWRHWGEMRKDYVGFNDKGEKITAPAHGGTIDIQGVTVATVNDKVQLQKVETWFDPLEMFRQIAPKGVVNKQIGKSATNGVPAMEEELKNDSNGNMKPELETNNSIPGERPVHDETSNASVGSQPGTKTEPIVEKHSAVDRTTSSGSESHHQSITSAVNQDANQHPRNPLNEDILSSTKQATSLQTEHDMNDQGNKLDQPLANDSNQAQLGSFTAGACPFLTGPVPFGGSAQAAADANQIKGKTAKNAMGEDELGDEVGWGAALASADGSKETREAREEMGTIEAGEREEMNTE